MLQKVSTERAFGFQRASECRAKAEAAFNEAARQELLELEHRWLLLARSYELSERANDFTDEISRRFRARKPRVPEGDPPPRPVCSKCGQKMRLIMIEPSAAGSENPYTSTFACQCGHTHEKTEK